jgi:hypothetical protein
MTAPLVVDLPHTLGAAEAQRRIAGGIGKLKNHIPGASRIDSAWEGNRLTLHVAAMGQQVTARIDVEDRLVRVELTLPPGLSFFRRAVEAALRRKGGEMLEDRSGGSR